MEVSLHRREHSGSPYANFGRMPPGWVKSSQNNAKLKAKGALRRGYQDPAAVRTPDFHSVLDTVRSPVVAEWAGFNWTPWTWDPPPSDGVGLYRIRQPGEESLLYVGQGRLRSRLARTRGAVLGDLSTDRPPTDAGHSWVMLPDLEQQQLLECENDLIASHVLVTGRAPEWQFRRY